MRLLALVALTPLAACGGGGSSSTPGGPPGPSFATYPLSVGSTAMYPTAPITVGSDGALWLIATDRQGISGSLWRVTPSGAATMQNTSVAPYTYGVCTRGPDGAVWFSSDNNSMGRITATGSLRYFPLAAVAAPSAMTVGADGALWFTDWGTHALGRITTAGVVTEYPSTLIQEEAGSIQGGIAAGSDGALWFTSYVTPGIAPGPSNDRIGRYSPATGFTSFAVHAGSSPNAIAAGPDGALWFTEGGSARIGRITTAGVVSQYPLPAGSNVAAGITSGPANALWFVTTGGPGPAVGKITTAGAVTLTAVPSQENLTGGIVATSDGTLWLTSDSGLIHFSP